MSDVVEKLKQLKELLDDGVLTQEEFDAQKNQLRLPMEVVTGPAGAVGGQQLTLQMPSGSTRQAVVPAGLKAGDNFRVAAPVPQEMHAENTPELEYTVDDECYWICSGGGSQKIKLYKDDIAFEQTCPAPVLGVCCFPCGTVPIDVACFLSCCTGCFLPFGNFGLQIAFCGCPYLWGLWGRKMVTRTPYRQLKNVQLNYKEGGSLCSCLSCFQSTFFIGGLFGLDTSSFSTGATTPKFPMAMANEQKLLAMTSEISKRMAKAKALELTSSRMEAL